MTAEAEVKTDVHETFELPTVTYSVVGEYMAQTYVGKTRKDRTCSNPGHHAVPSPYMLTQFDAGVNFVLVAVAAFEVTAHCVAAPKSRQQSPGGVAVSKAGMQISGEDRTAP